MSKQAMIPYYFPEEILLQIFHELPVKSLGKCMCVSKAWYSLIKNPSFISTHVKNQSQNSSRNNHFLLMTRFHVNVKETKVEYSLRFDDQEFSKYAQLQDIPFDSHHYIVGSCNGLLCLVEFRFSFDSKFILCNPIIKKCLRLPKPCFCSLPFKISVGFGFDSIRNDYKLLKISKKDVLVKYLDVEIYSLKRNSWKILDPPKYDLYSDDFMVFVNGVVHWIACERVNRRNRGKFLLLGFDMGYEVFKEIMLPESLSKLQKQSQMYVMPYGILSSIAVIETVSQYYHEECNIWVMKNYGMVESWTKMFSFSLRIIEMESIPRVLGFRKNGGLILNSYSNRLVVSLNLESSEISSFGFWGMFGCVFSYMESLVLLDQETDDSSENGSKHMSNASNSIEGAAGHFAELAAGNEANDDSSDAEDCTSSP